LSGIKFFFSKLKKIIYICRKFKKNKTMTLVSPKEFNTCQDKYLDLAEHEEVCIKRGDGMYHLMYRPLEIQYPEQPICDDNSDLETAITGDELRKRMHRRIHAKFSKRA
jgi:hypothetical protein